MTALDILTALMEDNNPLWYEPKDGKDLWPTAPVPATLRPAIAEHKDEIIRLLTTTTDTLPVVYHRMARGLTLLMALEEQGTTESDRYRSMFGAWTRLRVRYEEMIATAGVAA